MTGSEINVNSIKWAEDRIIKVNPQLVDKIIVRYQSDPNRILDGVILPTDKFDFTMCNPPFFASLNERKERMSSVCPIAESEECTNGGETSFLERYTHESVSYWR